MASACGAALLAQLEHGRLEVEHVLERVVALRPAAGGSNRHHRPSAPTRGELERDVAAQRVADQMGGVESRVVHRTFDRVRQDGVGHRPVDPRAARVSRQRQRQHVVPVLERRQHELPGAPGVDEAVQCHERRTAAAAVGGGERRRAHAIEAGRPRLMTQVDAVDYPVSTAHSDRGTMRAMAELTVARPGDAEAIAVVKTTGHVSIKYGLTGPNLAVVTACTTSTHCIGLAARLIQSGDADFMLAGGGGVRDHTARPRRFLRRTRVVDAQRRPEAREPAVGSRS